MKDGKRYLSELPEVVAEQRAENGAQHRDDPNQVPPEEVDLLSELGIALGARLKRGRYGVVFQAELTEAFHLERLSSCTKLHYLFVRSETNASEEMRPGHKLAVKYCDIASRKAYRIEDVEQRIHQEIDFFRRVQYSPTLALVRVFFVLATSAQRYYICMELAEDNLQCLSANLAKQKATLPAAQVLAMYQRLLSTVKALHQQKLTYGMMRTSNILLFGKTMLPELPSSAQPTESGPVVEMAFQAKIADFVRSLDLSSPDLKQSTADDAIEEDLDDLFYLHYELFALTTFDFAKYQVFKESIKILTDINAHRDSASTLDKAIELVRAFASEQSSTEPAKQAN